MSYSELNFEDVTTYSINDRTSKVKDEFEGKPTSAGVSFEQFIESLPDTLKVKDLKSVAQAVVSARESGNPVIAMLGGHVIKSGCSPILADLMDNGFITHFASNGSAAIHDTELAFSGQTSEDVAENLADGSFGMVEETAKLINGAARNAVDEGKGFGEKIGETLDPNSASLLCRAYQQNIPYTLHVAMGTDIVHQHPSADGAAIGESSMRDFRIFGDTVSQLGNGGVVLNFGSAVIMPEVFLKALSVSRNLGHDVRDFTTANFDMVQHYRPRVNVVSRPVMPGGEGYAITGHHEIMIPMLAATIKEYYHVTG